jgi:haloalkane dehalogenase
MIRLVRRDVAEVIEAHAAAGRRFEAGGIRSFMREQQPAGGGPVVILLHGVPASSFLYRKVIPALADQGLHAIAFDFPGLGLADRPESFDYTWSGLARWMEAAIDSLAIERCHLVVHDIGGPIGFEWAIRNRGRLISMTVLNSIIDVATFRRPWPMQPFSVPVLGALWLRSLRPRSMSELFYRLGIADRSVVPRREVYAYYHLLKRGDGGRAFLRIMRGFELTENKQRFLHEGLAERDYPARIVWGERDAAIGSDQLRAAQRVFEVADPVLVPAKHFLQEDQPAAVASAVGDLIAPLG